jgi:1,5-anhydro-D-fructose reductase (1,5-anhydro-D-mannitol-forming)
MTRRSGTSRKRGGVPVRIAVVGVWHVHADEYVEEMLQDSGYEVVGVFDDDAARAAPFAARHGLPVIDTFALALGDEVDAIMVCTETSAHERVISAALRADKHVFTEKVLTADPAEARALEQLAEDRGRVLFVSLQRLAEPWLCTMLEVIRSGVLGEITASRLRYQHAGAVEGWLPEGFLVSAQSGGGSIIDLGAHGYYLSLLLHGAFPVSLSATAQPFRGKAFTGQAFTGRAYTGQDVEDHSTVVLSYPNGATSTLETSLVAGPYARWWEVYGTRGFAVIDSRDDLVHVCTGDGDWVVQENGPQRATPLQRFLAAVTAGRADDDNVRTALRLTSLVADSYRSVASGGRVETADPVE